VGIITSVATTAEAPSQAACGLLLMRLARASGRRMASALEDLGMSGQELAVLQLVAESAGGLSQQQLSQGLRIHPSNLVGVLDSLEDDGLIARIRDPADRRRHIVGLTPAGLDRLKRAHEAARAAERELLEPLAPEERAQLHSYLRRLTAHSCGMRGC
jgi:DNA-binding MarR family transcriptional regulator